MNRRNQHRISKNAPASTEKVCYVKLQQMCRICMKCDQNLVMTNIFQYNKYFQDHLHKILYQCTGVDVRENHCPPIFICASCVESLKIAWNLKEKCKASFGKFTSAKEEYDDDVEPKNRTELTKDILLNNFKNKRKQKYSSSSSPIIYNKPINIIEMNETKAAEWMKQRKNTANACKKRKLDTLSLENLFSSNCIVDKLQENKYSVTCTICFEEFDSSKAFLRHMSWHADFRSKYLKSFNCSKEHDHLLSKCPHYSLYSNCFQNKSHLLTHIY